MSKNIQINIPGKKGYKGMDEVTDPALLPDGICAEIQGLNPANGDLDGRYVGTGAAINSVAMPKVYNQTIFRSTKGKNYILGYTGTGKIIYTANDWSDWDGTQYVKLSTGADLMFETTIPQGATLITGAPHVKVAFGVMGNNEVIVSNGMDDVYTITGKLNTGGLLEATLLKSDSAATTIENSNFPPFFDMIYLGDRSLIHDGETIRVSAPGDDKRFYSTVEERVNGIWDDNDWCAPGAPGESSFITSKFIHIGGLDCLITTTNGVYLVSLVAGGNGIPRLNILSLLTGAGCPTGACCMKWGTFYFLSDYNGGSWLGMQRGSAGGGKGEPIDIEAQNGWGVFEAAPGIATTLKALHATNFALVSDVIDTREDFEGVAAGQRENVDCITNPGSIFINAKTKLSYTVGDLKVAGPDGLYAGESSSQMAAAWDATYPATKIYDNDPNKATNDTAYTVNTNYGLIRLTPATGHTIADGGIQSIELGTLIGGKIFQQINTPPAGFYAKANDTWQTWTAKELLKNIPALYLRMAVELRSGGGGATRTTVYVYIPILFSIPYNISSVSIFDLRYDTSADTVRIGELYIEGISVLTGTYISNIRPVANLTASTNLELGRFSAMFKKVNNALYPKIYVRGGSSSTMDAVLSTTIATTNVAIGDSTITLASVAGIQVGDKLTTTAIVGPPAYPSELFFIKSISGNVVTITGTFTGAHLIGAAVTIRGSVAAGTWSDWTLLTLQQLYRGFDFRTLMKYGTSTAVTTDANGVFYWQFKVTLDLDAVTGVSPLVDRLRLGCVKGTLPLSNHLMSMAPDDSLMLCAPQTSDSTENDLSLILNTRSGQPWKIAGQHIDSIVQSGKDFIVNAGRKMAKLWTGNYNYIYNAVAGTSDNTPILKEIITKDVTGSAIVAIEASAMINKYDTIGVTDASLGSIVVGDVTRKVYKIGSSPACTPPVNSGQFFYGFNVQHVAVDEYGTVWCCYVVGGKVYAAETDLGGYHTNIHYLWNQSDFLAPHNDYEYLVFTIVADQKGKVWVFAAPNKNSYPPHYTDIAYASVDINTGEIYKSTFANPQKTGSYNTSTFWLQGFLYDDRIYLGMQVRDYDIVASNAWLYPFDGGSPVETNEGEVSRAAFFTAASGNLGEIFAKSGSCYYQEYGGTSILLIDAESTKVCGIASGSLNYVFYNDGSGHYHYKYGASPSTLSAEQTITGSGSELDSVSSLVCAELENNNILVIWNRATDHDIYYCVVKEATIVVAPTKLFAASFVNAAPNMSIAQYDADNIYLAVLDVNVGVDNGAVHVYRITPRALESLKIEVVSEHGKVVIYEDDADIRNAITPESENAGMQGTCSRLAVKVSSIANLQISDIGMTYLRLK